MDQHRLPTDPYELRELYDELTRRRNEVADRMATFEGPLENRTLELHAAMLRGAAGANRPSETAGVAHILAAHPTRSELERLLHYVRSTNQIVLSRRELPQGDQSTNEIIFDLETQMLLTKNEEIVTRAIEIVDELNSQDSSS